MSQNKVDSITVEIIRNALISSAEEMKANLMRSAYNSIIYEELDFGVAVFNERGETLGQASGLPWFLCDLPSAILAIARDIGGVQEMRPGDVYLTNDPYACCFHPQDVTIVKPIYWEGELIGFAACRAHWTDLGGKSAIASADATEIYQEGIILRSVSLCRQGQLNEDIIRIATENSRLSRVSLLGDLQAQMGATATGEARVLELIGKYGLELFRTCTTELLQQGESHAREKVGEMPNGRYEAELFLDDDGVDLGKPLVVKATVIVDGDEMTIDLEGSNQPCRGPMNVNRYTTESMCRYAFKSLTSPYEPANEGHFRPLKVHIPEDCIFNAQKPSSVFWGFKTTSTLIDAIRKALAPAMPGRVTAGDYGTGCGAHIFGTRPEDGTLFVLMDEAGGGWGAKPFEDGENALLVGDMRNMPVEVEEKNYPMLVERYALRPDSGGAGRFRGGLGVVRDTRLLGPARLVASFERSQCRPWGFVGGKEGMGSTIVIRPASGEAISLQKCTNYPLAVGDVVSYRTGGGGGYRDPQERDPEDVLADVRDGLVSVNRAAKDYGVAMEKLKSVISWERMVDPDDECF